MSINRQYIFNKVVTLLKRETKFFTSSDVHMLIGVDAQMRIAEDIEYPKSNFSSNVVSGTWTVDMPSDFVKVDDGKDVIFKGDSYSKLGPRSQKLIGRDQILSAAPSVPQYYFMEDETTVGLYPPAVSGTVVVPYVKYPTSLSTDAATNELTQKCYMASVYWVMSECMLKDNDARYQVYSGLYDKEIQRLRGKFGDMFEENFDISPAPEYLR